jgi:hypothetical protein
MAAHRVERTATHNSPKEVAMQNHVKDGKIHTLEETA